MTESAVRPAARVDLLRVAICLACGLGLLLSLRLWLSSRAYPLTPLWKNLPPIPLPFDYLLFGFLLTLLASVAIFPGKVNFLTAFLLIAVALCVMDQSRWQPWFYQYVFMLAAFALYGRTRSEQNDDRLLNTCRLILVTLYFWAGVQKLGVGFIDQIFPSLVNPYLHFLFGRGNVIPRPFIAMLPLVEIGIGIGLLTRRFRNVSVVLALLMHLIVLSLLVPLRREIVIWPWNVAMMCFVVILFWRTSDFTWRDVVISRPLSFKMLVLLLFGIMPLFNLFGLWDSYLSGSLLSGHLNAARITISDSVKQRLPANIQQHAEATPNSGEWNINPVRWSLSELNVPPYSEPRVFKSIARSICSYAESNHDVTLTVFSGRGRLTGQRTAQTYDCSQL